MTKKDYDHIFFRAHAKIFVLLFSIGLSFIVNAQQFQYPHTVKQPFIDTIFGKVIVDNYRWMEDMKSRETQDWLQVQTNYANSFLDKIIGRDKLLAEYKALDSLKTETISGLIQKGNRYFYRKTLPGENVGKLYYRNELDGKEVLLFDPLDYIKDKVISYTFLPSNNGKKVAFSFSEKGKELYFDRILNVESKEFYPETIIPGSIYGGFRTWTPDDQALVFTVPNDTNYLSKDYYRNVKLKYHKVGTEPKHDINVIPIDQYVVLGIKSEQLFTPYYSADKKYLLVNLFSSAGQTLSNTIYLPKSDLLLPDRKWNVLIKVADQITGGTIMNEQLFFIKKTENSNGKLQSVPLQNLDFTSAKTVFNAGDSNITSWHISKDYLFIEKRKENKSSVYQVHLKTGAAKAIALPFSGAFWFASGSSNTNKIMINGTSWKEQIVRYHYDADSQQLFFSPLNRSIKYPGVDDLLLEELEVPGHDGVKVPLSLVYSKHPIKDRLNIVYMMGYGAYGSETLPYVGIDLLSLLNRGVIIAFAHTRGGGEKGEAWHQEGMKGKKQNTWKDFISCAEFLINQGYTSPNKLIGEGGSAGGILIGRTITERPDLFGVSVHGVPVSNAIRHVTESTIGANDAKEFGSITDSIEAIGLLEMDVYHHIVSGEKYPAVLATAGINDGRVPAWEAGKMIAAMQQASASGKPVFLQVNYNSGHNSSDKLVQFKAFADKFAFALWQVGHKDFQLRSD